MHTKLTAVDVTLLSNAIETPTTRRIRLALGPQPFVYHAGQAASLAVDDTEPTPYSIASAPSDTGRDGALEFLIKADGASRFGARLPYLEPGTVVRLTGPAGVFTTRDAPPDVPLLFVAGGTGIAPLRSMLREALNDRHGGRIALVYSARTPGEFAYLDEWRTLAEARRMALTLTLTGGATDWAHARGRTGAEHLRELATPQTLAFVCGPRAMVIDVSQALGALGVSPSAIRTEDW